MASLETHLGEFDVCLYHIEYVTNHTGGGVFTVPNQANAQYVGSIDYDLVDCDLVAAQLGTIANITRRVGQFE